MTNTNRVKGRDFEALIRRWLTDQGQPNSNPASIGRPGGDIILHNHPIMLEVKNRRELALSTWMRQAQQDAGELLPVLVHKRRGVADPAEQWCTMTTGTLVALLNQTGGKASHSPVEPSGWSIEYGDVLFRPETLTDDLETILMHVEKAIEQSKQARQP